MNDKPTVSVQHALELQRAGALIVDVRDDDEWARGHAEDAVHIHLDDIEARVYEIPMDRDVLLFCRSGRRSGLAQDTLVDRLGLKNVYNVEGGILAWQEAGLPIVHPAPSS